MGSTAYKTVIQKVGDNNEITVNLVLTIKLEGQNLSVSADTEPAELKKKAAKTFLIDEEDTPLIVPEIKNEGILFDFGTKEKE